MSLAREALRIATVRALRGATLVGERVLDSEHGPIEETASEALGPVVVVYTDDGKFGGDASARGLFAGGDVDLVIEMVVTQRTKVRIEGPDGPEDDWVWECPPTDAGMELTIGLIERQIKVALMDPNNAWAEVWRSFAPAVGQCSTRRGTLMREGVRLSGRQLVFPITLPADPTPGTAPGPRWTTFLAKVDATPDLAAIAPLLRSTIEGTPAERPEWETLRFAYGLTETEAAALQIAPPEAARGTSPDFAEPVE